LLLALVEPVAVSSALLSKGQEKALDAAKGDADPLNAYRRSDAFAANVAWHKKVGENEIRRSWFLDGKPNVAMVCTADLSKSRATTFREVYDWASQITKTRKLSDEQVLTLRQLVKNLPPSAKAPELKNLVLVSVSEEGKAKTYLYNRLDLPRDMIYLHDLTGAYVDTDRLSSQDKKDKAPPNLDAVFRVKIDKKQEISFQFDLPGKVDQSFYSAEYRYAVLDKNGVQVNDEALMSTGAALHAVSPPKD
jgi:hypothetical protein